MNFLGKLISDVLGSLFSAVAGTILEGIKDSRRIADAKKLGYSEGAIADLKTQQEVMRGAKAIDLKPAPTSISGVLGRL